LAASPVSEPGSVDRPPVTHPTLRRQLWLGIAAITLMACGVALALSALKIEGELHERYNDALRLAEEAVEAQQIAAGLRRAQTRLETLIGASGSGSRTIQDAARTVTVARARLGTLNAQLRAVDTVHGTPEHANRIEAALESLTQANARVQEELLARRIEPAKAREALRAASDHALAEIDTALPEVVSETGQQTSQMSQRAREYGQLARQGLVLVSMIALTLASLLGYIGWRAVRSNARLLDQLNQLAHEDGLTGAINRRGLDERLPVELARAGRIAYPLTIVMIDFDHFKRFNDRRGHQAGDHLLRGAVMAWRTHLRPMDLLARYGGEEFTLVLPACDAEQACALIDRLRPLVPDKQTFSAGVAKWNTIDSAADLLRGADAALLQAKKAGRNRTIVWGNEPQITLPLVVR